MSKIITGQEAKDKLLAGTKIIADAVLSTYGPNGSNVIINRPEGRFITKDGVSVAKEVNTDDPFENEAVQMLKEACTLTNKQAGDGTTTSMLFASKIIEEGFKSNINGIVLKRELEKSLIDIIEYIDLIKKDCKLDDIFHISMVSTNGDLIVSKMIFDIFKNNSSADIILDVSDTKETVNEFIEGYSIDGSVYNEQYDYIDDIKNGLVFVVDGKISSVRSFANFLHKYKSIDKEIIIIAEEFSKDIESVVYNNRNIVKIKLIKSPGYSTGRRSILENIAAYTNTTVVSPNQFYDNSKAGTVEIFSNKNNTLLFYNTEFTDLYYDRLKYIESKLEKETNDYEKEKISSVISKFKSGITIIKIGANSDIEYREMHDKIEDAVNACKSAMLDGIILGGGITAMEIANKINNEILVHTLCAPHELLNQPDIFDIEENNIYDPAAVLKCAITNAIAVAGTILTTNTIIINE